jgi:hypothetical protein
MNTITHHGYIALGEEQVSATLRLGGDEISLDVATTGFATNLPERLELVRFSSNTGLFTLINLIRSRSNIRLGVAALSTYIGGLAFERAQFESKDQILSRTWSFHIEDIAKIFHVNGLNEEFYVSESSVVTVKYTVSTPPGVTLECPSNGIHVTLKQNFTTRGNKFDGPSLELSYPIDISFPEEVRLEVAVSKIYQVKQFFSLLMGRTLPISNISIQLPREISSQPVNIHGLRREESGKKPDRALITPESEAVLAQLLDLWLMRYDELRDAIRLHMSGLENTTLPLEIRFQTFVQALEALHRRTAPAKNGPIDTVPIRDALRERSINQDVIDRVVGLLAHAHEPGLRQRLTYYWNRYEAEIATLRPDQRRKPFISRVAATRNHYAHRTERDQQVFDYADLWDATETLKALSHMALLGEIGTDTSGIGRKILDLRFAEYVAHEH